MSYNQDNDYSTYVRAYINDSNGKVEGCYRADEGLECRYTPKEDLRECPVCGKEVSREDMNFTRDCRGITFRLVCDSCWERLMEKGYDGEYYDELDEQIEADY